MAHPTSPTATYPTLVSRILTTLPLPWFIHHILFTILLPIYLPWPTPSSKSTYLTLHLLQTLLTDTELILSALHPPTHPPIIPHPYLPFLGHVLGIFLHGAKYFELVNTTNTASPSNQQHRPQPFHPIYTLLTLTGRTIIIADPRIAGHVQKKRRETSFYGMILDVTKRLVDFDDDAMEVIKFNHDGWDVDLPVGVMGRDHELLGSMLGPGSSLDAMSMRQLEEFTKLLDGVVGDMGKEKEKEVWLVEMVKGLFTEANSRTFYGEKNPFAINPGLVHDFWRYERGMQFLLLPYPLNRLVARDAYNARRRVNDALRDFIISGRYKSASEMIRRRVEGNLEFGLTPTMAGRSELILLFGVLGNAVPSAFWLLVNILGRRELLGRVRAEIDAITTVEEYENGEDNGDGEKKRRRRKKVIRTSDLKSKCPTLLAAYKESLRTIANLASVRLVNSTHTFSVPSTGLVPGSGSGMQRQEYTLQKGDMIQIASGVIHGLTSVWGSDAQDFSPDRFITESSGNAGAGVGVGVGKLPPNVPSAAYRAFGGGAVICPGRHFALTEILGFVAGFVAAFDVVEVIGGGETRDLRVPPKLDDRIPLSVMKPGYDPRVRIRRRGGEEDTLWRVEL